VLPSFLEFSRGSVFVAHNARFDFSFLNASLDRAQRDPLAGPPVCTAKLARRIVWPDVPNVRLRTLSDHFRTRARPCHRALQDAEACGEVLHALLELGEHLGLLTLGDLFEACTARGRPNFGKIRLADDLSHSPGVYVFRDRDGAVLYVGKSKDLRTRVRSYFYGDERKQIQNLLEVVNAVDGIETQGGDLEALVLEARLIGRYEPRYNRRGKGWRRSAYLKLDAREAFPRLKVVRQAVAVDDCVVLGPFSTAAQAKLAAEAIEDVYAIRRCSRAMGRRTRFAPCALADLGRCSGPCDGRIDPERYRELVGRLISSLSSPGELLRALEARMAHLASQERYEQAADVRDRLRTLARSLQEARRNAWLVRSGRLSLRTMDGRQIQLVGGALARAGEPPPEPFTLPCPRERAPELAAVRSWLARNPVIVEACDVAPSEPVAGGADLARVLLKTRSAALPSAIGRDAKADHQGVPSFR
jgi:DNA polymerase-3 subunit epsilon